MIKEKFKNIIDDVKLKEFYDPNALHDLSDIQQLSMFINVLSSNRKNYLKTFIESKLLNKEELLSIVPDHKLDEMIRNGFQYWDKHKVLDRKPREILNNYKLVIGGRSSNVNPYIDNIETFIIVDNAIIPLPLRKTEYADTYFTQPYKDCDVVFLTHQVTNNSDLYKVTKTIQFDATNNEVVKIHFEETSNEFWTSGVGSIVNYQKPGLEEMLIERYSK